MTHDEYMTLLLLAMIASASLGFVVGLLAMAWGRPRRKDDDEA